MTGQSEVDGHACRGNNVRFLFRMPWIKDQRLQKHAIARFQPLSSDDYPLLGTILNIVCLAPLSRIVIILTATKPEINLSVGEESISMFFHMLIDFLQSSPFVENPAHFWFVPIRDLSLIYVS